MRKLLPILILLIGCTKEVELPQRIDAAPEKVEAMLLLDFDGHYLTGTAWSDSPITLGKSGLNALQVQAVVDSVRADFKGFNVYVGTDTALYATVAPNRRQRIVITDTWQWYGNSTGTAVVGSFSKREEIPAFVFSSQLNYHAKAISENVSHELGHTLGLRHQSRWENGNKKEDYHSGNNSEAPIMGRVDGFKVGRWWNGTNSIGETQNDEQILRNVLK